MSIKVDLSKVVPVGSMSGEDIEETRLLFQMHTEAENYLKAFKWCGDVIESYLGIGVGGVIGIFLFHIRPIADDADEWIWIIVGDLPPAYISIEVAPNPATALDAYIGAMEEWVECVKQGKIIDGLIPVNVPASLANAKQLESRLTFLDREILSKYADDLKT